MPTRGPGRFLATMTTAHVRRHNRVITRKHLHRATGMRTLVHDDGSEMSIHAEGVGDRLDIAAAWVLVVGV